MQKGKSVKFYTVAEEKAIMSGLSEKVLCNLLGRPRGAISLKKNALRKLYGINDSKGSRKLDAQQTAAAIKEFMATKATSQPVRRSKKGETVPVLKNKGKLNSIVPEITKTPGKLKNHTFIVGGTNIEVEGTVKKVHVGLGFFKIDF